MAYIGIIVAMEEELEAVLHFAENIEKEEIREVQFIKCNIKGKKCVIAKSGVGKIHAARVTQIMIYEFKPMYIVNVGVAGGLNNNLKVGDVIISKNVVQHDFDITAFGHSKGYVPSVGNDVKADERLIHEFEQEINSTSERQYQIKLGTIASGDIFCTKVEMKDKIYAKFSADVVDMECGAIAQVCYLEKIPFIGIRSVSDIPNERNVNTYNENLKLAAKRCASVLKECLI